MIQQFCIAIGIMARHYIANIGIRLFNVPYCTVPGCGIGIIKVAAAGAERFDKAATEQYFFPGYITYYIIAGMASTEVPALCFCTTYIQQELLLEAVLRDGSSLKRIIADDALGKLVGIGGYGLLLKLPQAARAILVKMAHHNAFYPYISVVTQPAKQLGSNGIVGGSIYDKSILVVDVNKAIARDLPPFIVVKKGTMYIGILREPVHLERRRTIERCLPEYMACLQGGEKAKKEEEAISVHRIKIAKTLRIIWLGT